MIPPLMGRGPLMVRPRRWTPKRLQDLYPGTLHVPISPDTLFTDTVGTLLAVQGQPVAAARDLRRVLVTTQATVAARPVLARHPAVGTRNILPANSTNITDGAGWATLRASRAAAPDSATGEPATILTATETNVNGGFLQAGLLTLAPGTYTLSAPLAGSGWAMLQIALSTDGAQTARAWFNLGTGTTGSANFAGAAFSAVSSGIVAVGDGYRCRITFTVAVSGTFFLRPFVVDGNASNAVTLGAAIRIEAPQFEIGSAASAYQRRVSAFDVTEAGQRDLWYLSLDGIDDFMGLASAFAPAGAWTLAAACDWQSGFPAAIPLGSVSGVSLSNFANGLSVRADTVSNVLEFPAATGWPTLAAGQNRVDMIRVQDGATAQAWRNATPYPGSPVITGLATPVAGFDTLFRSGSSYGRGRLYDLVAVPAAITEVERLLLRRYQSQKAGVVLE